MILLYSEARCVFSHCLRIILHVKDMDFKIVDLNMGVGHAAADLMVLNPYGETPVLVDDIDKNNRKKDFVLLDANIMCEYIDERFPYPALMPSEPSERARIRMFKWYLDKELFQYARAMDNLYHSKDKSKKDSEAIRKKIIIGLDRLAHEFYLNKRLEYAFGNSFTIIDTALLPVLWRLKYYKIDVKPSWKSMMNYAVKLFNSNSFNLSLTPAERGMEQ
jgi:RNA polymerase-associated protein